MAATVLTAGSPAAHGVGQAGDGGVQLFELGLEDAPIPATVLDDDHRRPEHDQPETQGTAGEQVGDLAGDEVDAGCPVPCQGDQQEPEGDEPQSELSAETGPGPTHGQTVPPAPPWPPVHVDK